MEIKGQQFQVVMNAGIRRKRSLNDKGRCLKQEGSLLVGGREYGAVKKIYQDQLKEILDTP